MKKQPEYNLQVMVCNYLKYQHQNVLFLSDTVANLRMTFPQLARNKKIQKKDFHCPDVLILEPNKKYHGLFIELKIETPFKKTGELKKSNHLQGQQKTINELNSKGYFACFSWSFEQTKDIIDNYLNDTL